MKVQQIVILIIVFLLGNVIGFNGIADALMIASNVVRNWGS